MFFSYADFFTLRKYLLHFNSKNKTKYKPIFNGWMLDVEETYDPSTILPLFNYDKI